MSRNGQDETTGIRAEQVAEALAPEVPPATAGTSPHGAPAAPDLAAGSRRLAVGDRFRWQGQPVEVIDVADLSGWQQVVIRFPDAPRRPALSLPAADFQAGLTD